jgi:hypothetical protein
MASLRLPPLGPSICAPAPSPPLSPPAAAAPKPWGPQEFAAFLRVQTASELVVDRSASNELLKVTFNIRWGSGGGGVQLGAGGALCWGLELGP